jgi:Fusaric acid resistance protein-like
MSERAIRTRPTRAEVESVIRATIAAAIAWLLAVALTNVAAPVLAPLAAVITTRASVHATFRRALERSGAVVLGVIAAVGVGDAIGLNVWSIALLCGGSLAITQLVLRMPQQAATQVPVSLLAVMAAGTAGNQGYAWMRAFDTVLGASVGVVVALVLPSSRFADARDTIRRLSETLVALLHDLGSATSEGWSVQESLQWRRTARIARQRLVAETIEAVDEGRRSAHWSFRDRPHLAELDLYEVVLPRFERIAIGVWALARGLDDHAELAGGEHRPMANMADLLSSLGDLVDVYTAEILGPPGGERRSVLVDRVVELRERCAESARRQSRAALGEADLDQSTGPGREWMSYTALLVQVDRVLDDLRAPLPASTGAPGGMRPAVS